MHSYRAKQDSNLTTAHIKPARKIIRFLSAKVSNRVSKAQNDVTNIEGIEEENKALE